MAWRCSGGVAPNASQLRPVKLGADLQSLLKTGYAFEEELVGLYAGAAKHGARTGSHDDRVFFQTLLEEERAHAQKLIQWMRELEQPAGEQLPGRGWS